MREIRFRAWDKKTKQWICVGYAPLGEVTLFGVVEQWLMEHKEPNQTMLDRFGDVEESQFTGLKDKHGNDIYEGDIVKQLFPNYTYDETYGHKTEPKWIEKISHIEYRGHGFWVADEDFGWEGENLWNWEIIEVIGNIYQHPELIKQAAT